MIRLPALLKSSITNIPFSGDPKSTFGTHCGAAVIVWLGRELSLDQPALIYESTLSLFETFPGAYFSSLS